MMRRCLIIPILLCLTALLANCAAPGASTNAGRGALLQPGTWTGDPVAQTRFGQVQAEEAPDATWLWKAIPYATPPVGDLRWRAPRDPEPWRGIRRERSFNKGCTQFGVINGIKGSEDCLYLNIWRPRTAATGLPVYVWIHGGGNSMGSSTMVADYYGNRIANHGQLVFVSLNYRLGPFGWFTHPALREGKDPADDSGNYGTLDIIKALEWVRDNIAAFGGDPARVMIAGESAGGFNVLSMLISPRATGLFSRAMCQSGLAQTSTVAEGEQRSTRVLTALLQADGKSSAEAAAQAASMSPKKIRAYLRGRSDREIMKCYRNRLVGMADNAAIFADGSVIPAAGFGTLADGSYPNKVPLIIGSNREELKIFLFFSKEPSWRDPLYAAVAKYGSRQWKASGVDAVARQISSLPKSPAVYAYEFAWGAPDETGASVLPGNWGKRLGSFHTLEIPFFLGTDTVDGFAQLLLYRAWNKPGRQALSTAMMDYVIRFAHSGNPNRDGSGLPVWEPWSNGMGAAKSIVLNATREKAKIGMSAVEYTVGGVYAEVQKLEEPLRGKVLGYLKQGISPPK